MRIRHLLPLALPASLIVAACSATNPAEPGTGGTVGTATNTGGSVPSEDKLTIQPADFLLDLPQGTSGSVDYKAILVGPSGTTDLTADAIFSVDDSSLGIFAGATFNANGAPGKLNVHAVAHGYKADTSLTIKGTKIIITPGTPADAPTKFGGAVDASRAPSLAYPADGVLVPPNMNVLEFQFMKGAPDNDLFELTFTTPSVIARIYLTCTPVGAGCGYTPDAEVWKLVAEAARGGEPVEYALRGVKQASPAGVGVSTPRKISFAQEDMLGGLYYWNAGAGATMRYEFGKSGQSAELYLAAPQAGAGICVGCHVVSRDGKKIVEGLDFPGSTYKVFDVATKAQIPFQQESMGGSFFAFSPDSSQLMVSDTFNIALRDAATGAPIGGAIAQGAMPDWSPDGKSMVFAKGQGGITGVAGASLVTMKLQGTTWGSANLLVPYGGQNNYYPSFSPDNGWVLFNRSNGDSYDAKDATVWAVAAAGGNPIALANASPSPGGDSWPKWSPLAQMYRQGTIMWLTFSSRRAYGLRTTGGPDAPAQLWMTAFDPAKAAKGEDPSYPAFWLPFQDMASGNHIAQWVLHVERKPCGMSPECEVNEVCQNGICQPIPK